MFKDLEDYLSSAMNSHHSTFMPLLYALRIAYASCISQEYAQKLTLTLLIKAFNRVILIG
jgi:hypothetical protein